LGIKISETEYLAPNIDDLYIEGHKIKKNNIFLLFRFDLETKCHIQCRNREANKQW
jgi:hypothetical protein